MFDAALKLVEDGHVPDYLVRIGIKGLLANRLAQERTYNEVELAQRLKRRVEELKESPIALVPEKANEQHYELPPEFFNLVLGKRRKYSCCYYPERNTTLDQAEETMFRITCERAGLEDGMKILELGCGWGSLTLWMAENYPKSKIVAVSNSIPQREHIEFHAAQSRFKNIEVITADMNDFKTNRKFDRVISIEMFEHMRNYHELLKRISNWLRKNGKLFVHIFCHDQFSYYYEAKKSSDWMSRYFFTGGIMPSFNLLGEFNEHLHISQQWKVNGKHYSITSRDWLDNMDMKKEAVMPVLAATYGKGNARLWFVRWRLFFMACEELFGWKDGNEWYVGHYLFDKN